MTPKGWKQICLEPLLDLLPGYAFKSSQFSNEPSDGLPLIRIRDLTSQSPNTFYQGNAPPQYLVESGTVLVGMDGDFDIRRWRGPKALLNQRVCRIASANPEDASTDYLYYLLDGQLAELHAAISRTTVKHLSTKHLKRLNVDLPPLVEQKKIAEILGSVDEAIQATQAVIDQTRKVKQGLLQQLLTRGIGHTRFKQTEIGEIPESWEVAQLVDAAERHGLQTGPFGSQLHASDYRDGGVPVVMPVNLVGGQIVDSGIKRVPESIAEKLGQHRLRTGDIIFARRGDIGRSARVTEPEDGWLCGTGSLRVRPSERASSEYLALVVASADSVDWLNQNAVGQTMLNLNTTILGSLPFPLPPIGEQQRIAEIIDACGNSLKSAALELRDWHVFKRGLMQDLLTGRVRVAA